MVVPYALLSIHPLHIAHYAPTLALVRLVGIHKLGQYALHGYTIGSCYTEAKWDGVGQGKTGITLRSSQSQE